MPVERYPDTESCRRALRRDGFRQITFASNLDPEYWWQDETHEAAEVARATIYTYERHTNAYQQIAGRVSRLKPDGRPPREQPLRSAP